MIETRVTQYELRSRPMRIPQAPEIGHLLTITEMPAIDPALYAVLYADLGQGHHWTSRLLPLAALAREIHADGVAVHLLTADGVPAGWFELDSGRKPGETRLVHFGVLPAFQGLGLSRWFLANAISAAFAVGNPLVTLETNTLDHPAAAKLYKNAGFSTVSMRVVSTRMLE